MPAFTFHTKLVSQQFTEAEVLLSCFYDAHICRSFRVFLCRVQKCLQPTATQRMHRLHMRLIHMKR